MKMKDLSIADLKAAYDFVLIDLSQMESTAKIWNNSPERIPAYNEVKRMEDAMWGELMERTRLLEL